MRAFTCSGNAPCGARAAKSPAASPTGRRSTSLANCVGVDAAKRDQLLSKDDMVQRVLDQLLALLNASTRARSAIRNIDRFCGVRGASGAFPAGLIRAVQRPRVRSAIKF